MKALNLVLSYARKYRFVLSVTIFAMLCLVAVQLAIPWTIKSLLSLFSGPAITPDTLGIIGRITLFVLGIYLARAGLEFLRSYYAHVAGWGVVADLRKHIYERMQRFSLRFFQDKQTGQLMSRVINDTDQFEDLIAHAIPDIFVSFVTLVGVCAVLAYINWQLALLALIPIPFIVILMRLYARYVRPAFRERQKELGNLNAILADNLSGIREIKAFTREDEENEKFGHQAERYRQLSLKAIGMMSAFQPVIAFFSSLGLVIVIYFGGHLAFNQSLSIPDLVAFVLYLDLLYQPVRTLSGSWEQIQRALAGADRVAELLEETPEPQQKQAAVSLNGKASGAIVFHKVCFEYKPGQPVLENINLEIPARKVIALVGPSGVGKSTLVSLIPRFYDPTDGTVTLDGKDIGDIDLQSLRKQMSVVLQDVFLFYGSIRENILFGRPDATEADLVAAARVANAHDFIMSMPEGYHTLIGERGLKLSGGQKQRISIARAVLRDAPVLILDEATSAVDTETELLIQQALERLIAGRTTIIIAHRLSTIRNADKIVVLDGKRIAETGNHDELMKKKGLYHKLYTIQNKLSESALLYQNEPDDHINVEII
ncbi:ATP-binding cassette, subfamily B, MsbA [Dehalogenimonas formicexedens]|uniref:ATP-binding cassette, subfamily B, MsbA n=1 Tax=Dehalogenimonas formicexedens TaxID=1839801 RepID=A0A1P8F8R4_9CHLR|nr:ABC transporter ATP-binding protein [Dehalogenimonas formicexedens]APV44802.1 ATP-binding cassette, subfamily B, MsbA [Dehalogenimonas formicexedens]